MARQAGSQVAVDDGAPMTAPVAYRWAVGIAGLVALAALLPGARISPWLDWALLVVLIAVAHTLLTIPLKSRRLVSFSSAFMFVVFLRYGAVPAALAQFVGLLAAQIAARQVRTSLPPAPRLFIVFNLGQLTLCALLGGLASALLGEHGFWDAPSDRTAAIVTFAGVYLAANVALTTGAIYLSHGWQHVLTQLWPQTSLWTAISFVYSVPLALETVSLGNAIGLLFSSLVIFAVLAVISWIARLNVRLGAQNRELARINLELSAINEAGRVLAAQNDLASLWPTVHEQVGRVVPADAFFIATIDEERGRVTYQWVATGSGGAPGPEGPIEGLVAAVARSRRPVIAATPEEIAALGHGAVFPGRFAPASLIAAPLVVGERVVGVISAQSAHPEAYQPRHLSLFEALAGQTSVALENARLVAQLRVALRDREEYLSVVSHELKNPIASIRAYAQLASRRAGAHEDERVLQALARIAAQTDRLNRLVDDLLALSRIDTGRFEIAPSEIDLQAILREAVEAAQATHTRHRFSLALPAGEQSAIVDPARIRQVLDNLLSNAAKYSPEGSEVEVTLRDEGDAVAISVADQGIGISPEERDRIFERFYRGPQPESGQAPGLGIGLNIVLEIVRAHGGAIEVESTPSRGSTFTVRLPRYGQRRRAEETSEVAG